MLRKKQKDKKLVIVIGSIVGIIILILLAIIFGKLMGTIFIYEATDGRKGVFSLEPPTPYSLTLAYYESSGINDEARLKFQLIGKKRTVYSSLYELQVFHPDNRICKANNQVMSSFVKCCQVYGWDGTCATNQGSVCCGTKEFFTDNLKITIHNKEIFNQQNMEKDIYYETENFGVYINEICYGKGELKNIGNEIDPIWVEISECEVPINFYSTKEGGISYEFLFAEGINVTYPDTDGDGIRDNIDKCLNEKETFNNYQDEDGCPDENPNELCEFKAGEVLVFEAFNEKDIIYIETMYAEPTRWCHLFKPVILDEYKQIVYTDEILFDALKRGESYIVPQDLTIGIFYFAVKPYDMEIVCKLGQTYVVKDQICIDASAIVTPCYNGILDEQGTCITSPKQNIVCEGQVEVLDDGTQICNIYIPIRETYTHLKTLWMEMIS